MEADRTRLMLMDGDGNIRSHSSALPKEKLVCLSKLKFSHIFMRSSATVLFHGNAKQHNPSISSKLLTSLASCLPILLVIRLNIHSWGDLMSRYNSPSVMISASLPSAPVRSNLRPLQEAIIIWGKSYVSLTMLHFHYNSSHSLPANSYLLQTIRVYCSRVTCHTAPRFSKTRTALCTGTLAAKSTRKKKRKKEWDSTPKVSEWRSVIALLLQGVNGNVHTLGEQCVLSVPLAQSKSDVVHETWQMLQEEIAASTLKNTTKRGVLQPAKKPQGYFLLS